ADKRSARVAMGNARTRSSVTRHSPKLADALSDLHVGDTKLLDEAHSHDMRRYKTHAGIQPGEQVGTHVSRRQLPRLRELLGEVAKGNVALPEDCAARLQRLDAQRAVVHEDIAHCWLLRHRVDDLRAFAKAVFLPKPIGRIDGKGA